MSANTAVELFFFGFLAAVAAIALHLPTFVWLHRRLPQILDDQLFRHPFFNSAEQVNYQVFPLSMVKTICYIQLMAIPGWAKRKRFAGLPSGVTVDHPARILSKLNFWLSVAITVYGVLYFIIGGLIIYVYG